MMSSRKKVDAFWIMRAEARCAAISSEATSVAQATPSATRSAVRICGTVSGMMTLRKISTFAGAERLRHADVERA